jgi:hypothetical protein
MNSTSLSPTPSDSTANPTPDTALFALPVDPEHSGLRLAVVGVFIVSALILYALISVFVPQIAGLNLIAFGGALGGAALLTQVADASLKRRWQSGRQVEISADQVRMMLKDKVQREIDAAQHVNVLLWRFEITKRTRIPKGWYMVALALQQDERYLPVYTFVSPEDFNQMPYQKQYFKLQKQPDETDMRLAGQQRRLRTAEEARWAEGGEMTKADYDAYVARLRQQFPAWMPAE